jgi:hypothetical protein
MRTGSRENVQAATRKHKGVKSNVQPAVSTMLSNLSNARGAESTAAGLKGMSREMDSMDERLDALEDAILGGDDASSRAFGRQRLWHLGGIRTGTAIALSKVDVPRGKRARLMFAGDKTGKLDTLVKNTDTVDGVAGLDLQALDPSSGNADAGYPMGDFGDKATVTLTATLDASGIGTFFLVYDSEE